MGNIFFMKKFALLVCLSAQLLYGLGPEGQQDSKSLSVVVQDSETISIDSELAHIGKESLLDYYVCFQKKVHELYDLVAQIDEDLEYWKNEWYVEHRTPWYYKNPFRMIGKKKYHRKIHLSISKLALVKKEACTLLGIFYSYMNYFKSIDMQKCMKLCKL